MPRPPSNSNKCMAAETSLYPGSASEETQLTAESTRGNMPEDNYVSFVWRIQNLRYWEPAARPYGRVIDSPCITSSRLCGSQWVLKLLPKGEGIEDEHLRVSLIMLTEDLGYLLDCEWSILDGNGLPLLMEKVQNHSFKQREELVLPNPPTQDEVFYTRKSAFQPFNALTLRCRMWKSVGDLDLAEFICAQSKVEVTQGSIMWPFAGFSAFPINKVQTVPTNFSFKSGDFDLKFSFSGTSMDDICTNIELCANQVSKPITVTLKVTILGRGHQVIIHVERIHRFCVSKTEQVFRIPEFASRKELLEKRPDCMCDNFLPVLCEFIAVGEDVLGEVESIYCGLMNPFSSMRIHTPVSEPSTQESQRAPTHIYQLRKARAHQRKQ